MLLGQLNRRERDAALGEQEHVLRCNRVWPIHLSALIKVPRERERALCGLRYSVLFVRDMECVNALAAGSWALLHGPLQQLDPSPCAKPREDSTMIFSILKSNLDPGGGGGV